MSSEWWDPEELERLRDEQRQPARPFLRLPVQRPLHEPPRSSMTLVEEDQDDRGVCYIDM